MVIHRPGCRLYTREEEYKYIVLYLLCYIKESVESTLLVTVPSLEAARERSI